MSEHRSCPRWQVDWQIRLRLAGQEEDACCALRDINFKGARVCLPQRLVQDTAVKLTLCLSQDCHIAVEAWVVWQRSIEGANTCGLYFTKIKDADKEKIFQFTQSQFKDQMNRQIWAGVRQKEEGGEEMTEDRRIFERFLTALPLKYLDLKRGKEGNAKTRDLSAKGLGLIANEELAPQTLLEIWIQLSDKTDPFYTRAEVVWSKRIGFNECQVGLNLEKAELLGFSSVLSKK